MVRLKNRYIVVEIIPDDLSRKVKIQENVLGQNILNKVEKNYGDFGLAATTSGFCVKYCNAHTNICIIRARHGPHRFVTSSIPLITVICGFPARFRTLYLGATIKNCYKFIIKHQQNYIDRILGNKLVNKEEFIDEVMKIELFTKK